MTTTPHAELLTEHEIMSFAFEQRFKDGPSYIIEFARAIERALLARLAEQQPVAVIGRDWDLLWASPRSLSDIVKRYGLKIGAKLYAHPPAAQPASMLQRIAKYAENLESGGVDAVAVRGLLLALEAEQLTAQPAGAYLEGVNVERLQRAMAQAGQSCEVSHEALAAPGLLADHINRLAAAVVRNPELTAQPVARIAGVDEYGPQLEWFKHWTEFADGTNLYTQPTKERDVRLADDSNAAAPRQQRPVAGAMALGQHVGGGLEQAGRDPQPQGSVGGVTAQPVAQGEREAFEAYFAGSRRSRGKAKAAELLNRMPGGDYVQEHTQRHWWTWQQALASRSSAQGAALKTMPEQPDMGEGWYVIVSRRGEDEVCISSEGLTGKRDPDEALIVGAAKHLLSFVGYGLPPCSFDPDEAAQGAAQVPAWQPRLTHDDDRWTAQDEAAYQDYLARKQRRTAASAAPQALAQVPLTECAANREGDCRHAKCPQLRDGEPHKSGRHCPLDRDDAAPHGEGER